MDRSPPGSSVHGILQAGIVEWVVISFSRGSSQPRNWTWVSSITGRQIPYHWATQEALPRGSPYHKCLIQQTVFNNGCLWAVGSTEDEMAGWHHQLDGREFEWILGVGDGQGGLACCDSWGCRVGRDWATKLNWKCLKFILRVKVSLKF